MSTTAGPPRLTGTALVTGGGRGLGRVWSLALAAAGMRVAVTGRTPADLDETVRQGAALALPGDATDRAAVLEAVRRTTTGLGPLDLLLAGAGRFAAGGPLWQGDPDQWWRDVEVNLRGPMLALWAALPAMVERGAGRVVLVGSGFGANPTPGATAYSASKAALQRLVEGVAAELAGTGVTVVALGPGMVRTDMTEGFPAGFRALRPDLDPPAGHRWTPASRSTDLVLRIAAGELDALSGRYVSVRDDLDRARAAAGAPEPGTLRLVPYT